jgi:hypothetical protein
MPPGGTTPVPPDVALGGPDGKIAIMIGPAVACLALACEPLAAA